MQGTPDSSSVAAAASSELLIVFVSYAREDRDFVLHLAEALELKGARVCGDWQLIRGEDYEVQLEELQLGADAMIFVLSPDSAQSAPCLREVGRATTSGKPILPVVRREPPEEVQLPPALANPQWTYLRVEDDFITGVNQLFEAISTDFDRMPEHRQILQQAHTWERSGKSASDLLRREGLKRAEEWLSVTQKRPTRLPQATALQVDYIRASVKARSRGSRIALGIAIGVAVALAVLAVTALFQRQEAVLQRNEAQEQRQRAEDGEKEANKQRDLATEAAREAERQRAAAELNARRSEGIAARALTATPGQEFEAAVTALRSVGTDEAPPAEAFAGLAHAVTGLRYSLPLRGHASEVRDATFSPDGTLVVTASRDGTAKVWNVATGALLTTLKTGLVEVSTVRFSARGNRLAAAGFSEAQIYDTRTWKMVSVLKGHTGSIASIAVSPDGRRLLTNSFSDQSARLWDTESGATLQSFPWRLGKFVPNTATTGSVQFSQDGRRFVITKPNAAELRSIDGELERSFEGSFGASDLSPDGTKLIATGRAARLLDTQSGAELHSLSCPGGQVLWATFSPDSRQVVTTMTDGSACLWDAAGGRLTRVLGGNARQEINLAVNRAAKSSPDGRTVVTTADDGTAQVWSAFEGRLLYRLQASAGSVVTASFSPDGRYLVTPMSDQTARIWMPRYGLARCELRSEEGSLSSFQTFSAAPRFVSTGSGGAARVWNASTCKPVAVLDPKAGTMIGAAVSPDERVLVTATSLGHIQTWSLRTRQPLHTISPEQKSRALTAVALSPDGRTIATGSLEREVVLWRISGGKPRTILKPEGRTRISSLAFAPDGSRVAAGHGNRALLIDVHDGRTQTVTGHEDTVTAAVFSPDGATLATASADRTARLWDAHTGRALATITGHGGAVLDVAFSPNGERIVTASGDQTVRVWDVATRQLLVPLRAEAAGAVFSRTRSEILTMGADGALRVFPISLEFFRQAACELLVRQPEATTVSAPCAMTLHGG